MGYNTTISSYHSKSSSSSNSDSRRLIEGRSSTIYLPTPHALSASNYPTNSRHQSSNGSTYRFSSKPASASQGISSKSDSSRLQPHKTSFVQNTGSAIPGPFLQTSHSVSLSPSLARARKRCYAERMTTSTRIGYKLTAMKQMILRRLHK